MFINVSNHNSLNWSSKQIEATKPYGSIIDIPFPNVSPYYTKEEVENLAKEYLKKILEYKDPIVMIQGEFSFTYALVNLCKEKNIQTVTSCSERKVDEYMDQDGITHKKSHFDFVCFRPY